MEPGKPGNSDQRFSIRQIDLIPIIRKPDSHMSVSEKHVGLVISEIDPTPIDPTPIGENNMSLRFSVSEMQQPIDDINYYSPSIFN